MDTPVPSLEREQSHLYTIMGDEDSFYTGKSRDHQVVVVVQCPNVVTIQFLLDGSLAFVRTLFSTADSGVFSVADDERLRGWMTAEEYVVEPISVRRFYLDDYHIGIVDYPHELLDRLEDSPPNGQIVEWMETGKFVLQLNQFHDVWIDSEGDVIAT